LCTNYLERIREDIMIKGELLQGFLAIAVAAWMLLLAGGLCVAEAPQDISGLDNYAGFNDGQNQSIGSSNATPNPNLAAPDLVSPSGIIKTGKPTYNWKAVSGCVYYCLMVWDDNNKVILKQWYDASDFPAAAKICSVTPLLALNAGGYKWQVESWNCKEKSWSKVMKFTVCGSSSLPGKAALVSPRDVVGTKNPTFVWNAVAESSRYCLKVSDAKTPNAPIFEECYDASEVLSGKTCTVSPKINLPAGSYRWWVRTANCKGDGPWSDFLSFKYIKQLPGRCNPLTPTGLTASSQPTFTWTAASAAKEYHIQVDNDAVNIMDIKCDASDVTSGSRCSLLLPDELPDDVSVYFWRIQASNDEGVGPWSSYRYFEIVCPMKTKFRMKLPGVIEKKSTMVH
jgi:hypothetical protein